MPGLRWPEDDGVVVLVAPVLAAGCFVAGAAVVLGLVPFIMINIYIFKYYIIIDQDFYYYFFLTYLIINIAFCLI